MRGKIIRHNPIGVEAEDCVTIPIDFYKLQNFVTLMSEVMFVKKTVFMIISARKIKFVNFKHR